MMFVLIGRLAAFGVAGLIGIAATSADDDAILFTPPGFHKSGRAILTPPAKAGHLKITIRDARTGQPTFCRVNVVGADGDYYFPKQNYLSPFALTGQWTGRPPNMAMGNRAGKAPFRYLGRFFYSWGEAEVAVPPGPVRIEVWKGLEFRPEVLSANVGSGESRSVAITLVKDASLAKAGYFSGDSHVHIPRQTDADDQTILDLMEAADVHFASILAYNEPAGPYTGIMKTLATPQFRGLGASSIRARGDYHIFSGQEYRSGTYGHLNLYFRDDLVLDQKSVNAANGPIYGRLARQTRDKGGFAFYCHGGYAQTIPYAEIFADALQGDVNGVELLQFGIYREMGLDGWYQLLNIGYRFPCLGASDYPACRWLADCRTYVQMIGPHNMQGWFDGAAAGRSFVTTGPLLLLDVDGKAPGSEIAKAGADPHTVKARIRVRCEVTPVTGVQLIVNGKVVETFKVPTDQRQGKWAEFERPVTLERSSWIAVRAFSTDASGRPDAEAHTNPVYVLLDGKAPFDHASLDALVVKLDKQIVAQKRRRFDEKTDVVAYFERSRDILLKIREANGLRADQDVRKIANEELPVLNHPGARSHSDAELKAFLKPVPARSPHEALKTFETIPGFHMELIASEPGVHSPISAAIDEDGNLYVTEMIDYPYYPKPGEKPLGAVRLLRDRDGDGRYEESHVLADHLLWAGGVACWKGGAFVAAPPDIWYFKDTDGDGKADIKRKVFTGFGTQSQQYMLNNLKWGLDHKIYGSTAGNGGQIRPGDKPNAKPISVDHHDFRFDPVTEEFEPIAGTIQFGNSFDDWGNRFLCSESGPLYQAILDQRYLIRNPYLPAPSGIHDIAGGSVPIFRISPIERWRHVRSSRRIAHSTRSPMGAGVSHHVIDAGAGVTIYRGTAYPKSFYGNAIVGDAQNNVVHRMLLTPDGVTFRERRADAGMEFLRSSDNWFRPVNFVNAPDGTLYCLDMSREILESIHIPFDVLKFIDLKNGRNSGRVYRIAPDGFHFPGEPHLSSATTAELVALLEHANGWHRDTAQRLLFERQDKSAIEPLRKLLHASKMPQARLGALWSLDGLKSLGAADIQFALADPQPPIRAHAVRLAEGRLDHNPALLAKVASLADDASPLVRFQTAFSLGESQNARAVAALAKIARRDASDPWIRAAVLSSVARVAPQLLIQLLDDRRFVASSTGHEMASKLAYITGVRNRADERLALLDRLAALHNRADAELKREILQGFGDGLKQVGGFLSVHAQSARAGEKMLAEAVASANETATDSRKSNDERIAAIRLLGAFPRAVSGKTLASLLSPSNSESVESAAVAALAGYGDGEIAGQLLEHWRAYAPDVRTDVVRTLLSREAWTLAYLRSIKSAGSDAASLDPLQRKRLLESKSAAVRDLAKGTLGNSSASPRSAVIAGYRSCLSLKPNAAAGKKTFERECSVCHQIGNTGFAIAPSLASSNARAPEALLMHILDPNQYVPPKFVQYVAVDRNGRSYTGIITVQTPTSITLKREKDASDTLLRANIEELSSTGKSLMPEGFENKLSKQDLADVIAYLQTVQAGNPNGAPLDIGTKPGLMEP